MNQHHKITESAVHNYSHSTPWPEHDAWHQYTYSIEKSVVEQWLADRSADGMRILNAGSGGTQYKTKGSMIHLDIVQKYIEKYEEYMVGSIEQIELPDESIDGLICVGSVLNYADAQRAISEFARVLKKGGFYILEFERSNSAEFLWRPEHGRDIFFKTYYYNGQEHPLWLYSERHIREILAEYHLNIQRYKRIHNLSSLLYRLGVSEERAAPYSRFDSLCQCISYPLAHNVMLLGQKMCPPGRDD